MIATWAHYDALTDRVIRTFISDSTTALLLMADPAIGGSPVWHATAKQRPPRRVRRRARKRRNRQ